MILCTRKLRRNRAARRRAFTVVEMLVAMTLTLVMLGTLVRVFETLGTSVRNSRSAMVMHDEVRIARQLLQRDLAGATCRTVPPVDGESSLGYLEYIEGVLSEQIPSRLLSNSGQVLPPPVVHEDYYNNANDPDRNLKYTFLGDADDILMLTVRRPDDPFVGWFEGNGGLRIVKSDTAEVIWWTTEDPNTGLRTVRRRVLLIAPWLKEEMLALSQLPSYKDDIRFFANNDISSHVALFRGEDGMDRWLRFPNSLSDTSRREYRFAHFYRPVDKERPAHLGDSTSERSGVLPDLAITFPHPVIRPQSWHAAGAPVETGLLAPLGTIDDNGNGTVNENRRLGEDIVLTNVLAFDIQAYDPGAPLFHVPTKTDNVVTGTAVVGPGDPGFVNIANWDVTTLPTPRIVNGRTLIPSGAIPRGFGAFVDLNYPMPASIDPGAANQYNLASGTLVPTKSFFDIAIFRFMGNLPQFEALPSFAGAAKPLVLDRTVVAGTYDTWSTHYEQDGLDQDGDNFVDEGTNGLDEDGVFGPDDPGERETSPPYEAPLRGLQVTIRTVDVSSRQIREVSVTQNYVER